METWKTNLDETKKRYIDWWNHKGIILKHVGALSGRCETSCGYPCALPGKRPEFRNGSIRNGVQNTWTGTWHTAV